MTDERDEQQLPGGEGVVVPPAPPVDPWAQAFASLEEEPAAAPQGDQGGPETGAPAGVGGADGAQAPAVAGDAGVDAAAAPAADGGPVLADGADGVGAGEDIESVVARYQEEAEQRAIEETARMLLDRTDEHGNKMIRQSNGRLGATLNDPDIYRVDPDTGTATFYNPDTGRPFTGDNPRMQAKQWVDAYNDELRDAFNDVAGKRQAQIEAEAKPVIELLKFVPTYEKLDPVRRQMLDVIIEDYEIHDKSGNHIGYSIDLDKALDKVNRQVAAVKATAAPPAPPTGPALDMPTTGGGPVDRGAPKSLAEAMEAEQNKLLEKLKGNR